MRYQDRAVTMSLRPPPRFAEGGDLTLWLQRFELYVKQLKIPIGQWTRELVPLLENGPFCINSQQGLVHGVF